MKTMLIPVDLSSTTENTIQFAAAWIAKYDYERVVFMYSFFNNIFDRIVVSADAQVNPDYMQQERADVKEQLDALSKMLNEHSEKKLKSSVILSEEPMLRSIIEFVQEEHTDLILLTGNNYDTDAESKIDVISIAKASPVKLLVVPPNYVYKEVKQMLVPCDFNRMDSLDKLKSLHASPAWADSKLAVLNVDPKENYLHPDEHFKIQEENLHAYLQNFKHELFYSNEQDIIKGIMDFVKTNDVQLIIALPGKHSFLYALTHKSISEAIYKNAHEPVLILK